jgi:hypothetical protein
MPLIAPAALVLFAAIAPEKAALAVFVSPPARPPGGSAHQAASSCKKRGH